MYTVTDTDGILTHANIQIYILWCVDYMSSPGVLFLVPLSTALFHDIIHIPFKGTVRLITIRTQ